MAESGSRSVANTTSGLASSEPSCYDAVGDGREGRSALCADHVHHLWETKRDPQASKTRPGQKHKVGCQLGVEPEHLRADVHIQNGAWRTNQYCWTAQSCRIWARHSRGWPKESRLCLFSGWTMRGSYSFGSGLGRRSAWNPTTQCYINWGTLELHGTVSSVSEQLKPQASPNNLKLRGRWSADSSFKRYEGLPRLLSCTRSFPQK